MTRSFEEERWEGKILGELRIQAYTKFREPVIQVCILCILGVVKGYIVLYSKSKTLFFQSTWRKLIRIKRVISVSWDHLYYKVSYYSTYSYYNTIVNISFRIVIPWLKYFSEFLINFLRFEVLNCVRNS